MAELRDGDSLEAAFSSGRPEAAAVIWDPLGETRPGSAEDSERQPGAIRRSGAMRAAVALVVASGLYYFGYPRFAAAVALFGTTIGLAALLSPRGVYTAIETLFAWTSRVVGQLTTWLLLAPTFYLFFFPFGLVMRSGRRDRMRRFNEPEATTYWIDRRGRPESSLERQY